MQPSLRLPFSVAEPSSARGEATLIERVRCGDLTALGEAYDAHHEHVRAFARRMTGDATVAEDLVQDTFLALPRALARFRGEASLRTFLVSVAVNHARHHVRAAARRRAALTRLGREPVRAMDHPDADVGARELAAILSRALDALPLDQRVAVVLCDVEERTSAEAARIVGVPEGTIRTRVFHARRKLGKALAGEPL